MTMPGYKVVNIRDMISGIGEDGTANILSSFSCPLNPDIEEFLKFRAIEFFKQGTAGTYVVFYVDGDENRIVGYFALANKILIVDKESLNSKWRQRFERFGTFHAKLNQYIVAVPLIGQLGKNYSNGCDNLITGDELLRLALDKVEDAQRIINGKMVYVECEDTSRLLDFYSRNGFSRMEGQRAFSDTKREEHLVQMVRYR